VDIAGCAIKTQISAKVKARLIHVKQTNFIGKFSQPMQIYQS